MHRVPIWFKISSLDPRADDPVTDDMVVALMFSFEAAILMSKSSRSSSIFLVGGARALLNTIKFVAPAKFTKKIKLPPLCIGQGLANIGLGAYPTCDLSDSVLCSPMCAFNSVCVCDVPIRGAHSRGMTSGIVCFHEKH